MLDNDPGRHAAPDGWRPVPKVVAAIVAWLGTTAGVGVLDALTTAVPHDAVWGVLVGGALTAFSAYMKRTR